MATTSCGLRRVIEVNDAPGCRAAGRGLEIAYGEVTPSGFAGVVINSIDVVNIDGQVALRTQATNILLSTVAGTDTGIGIYTLNALFENGEIASLSA